MHLQNCKLLPHRAHVPQACPNDNMSGPMGLRCCCVGTGMCYGTVTALHRPQIPPLLHASLASLGSFSQVGFGPVHAKATERKLFRCLEQRMLHKLAEYTHRCFPSIHHCPSPTFTQQLVATSWMKVGEAQCTRIYGRRVLQLVGRLIRLFGMPFSGRPVGVTHPAGKCAI